MRKVLTAVLLLLPAAAFAECGFTRTGNAMTIVVGKDAKCLSSGQFRAALKADIAAALEEQDVQAERKRAYDDRNSRGSKLWAIAERRHQEGGGYFGQRR
ncbi:hypothetical protein [Noviherbaspirillum denitrificans]|uniref:Uncharacterized protein n=1 Tax=Noviherbaspirillum denitrificans TaxID=1968433 RepID=A0A254T8Y4_9BURK|nr:hypothetical protein [Noviherbaspirillum denitrificans]OWW18617.1 hypothetical protein AYR66_03245 [Noviherbaspirillum denitrificans]